MTRLVLAVALCSALWGCDGSGGGPDGVYRGNVHQRAANCSGVVEPARLVSDGTVYVVKASLAKPEVLEVWSMDQSGQTGRVPALSGVPSAGELRAELNGERIVVSWSDGVMVMTGRVTWPSCAAAWRETEFVGYRD